MTRHLTLGELFPDYVFKSDLDKNVEISGLTIDSRKATEGIAFLACRGGSVNGADFAEKAVEQGASAIFFADDQPQLDVNVPVIRLADFENQIGAIAARFYQYPSQDMNVIGVTGTNGKTSVSHFIAQMLEARGDRTAVLGTVGYGFLGDLQTASHTTPDVVRIQQMLADLSDAGAKQVAMEVSSHALDQKRVDQIAFDQAVFTNLTRDHLDYHGSMASYGEAKGRLFSDYGIKHAVINLDDDYAETLLKSMPSNVHVSGYGMSPSPLVEKLSENMICMERYHLTADGIWGEMSTPKGKLPFKTQLIGRFNLSNLMASVAVLQWQGCSLEELQTLIEKVQGVSGRMEKVEDANERLLVIDYAHTPDALSKALVSLREHCTGKLWCVFGCGGDRDQGKRSLMGKAAEKGADVLIVTSDNPRTESPQAIINNILEGIEDKQSATVCLDRKDAIQFALNTATAGDVVLVAGKGHEDYQEIDGHRFHFNDREVIEACLESHQ